MGTIQSSVNQVLGTAGTAAAIAEHLSKERKEVAAANAADTEVIKRNETSYEEIEIEDADIVLTAFGSMTRNIKAAMKVLREKGLKVGCFRPITLSPFPSERLLELSKQGKDFVVVEMNMGQMFKDVKSAVEGNSKVSLLNRPCGEWLSVDEIVESVLEEVKVNGYARV